MPFCITLKYNLFLYLLFEVFMLENFKIIYTKMGKCIKIVKLKSKLLKHIL